MNKKVSSILIGLILLGLFSSFITPKVTAVPGDLLTPGTTMSGLLNYDNQQDNYGIAITEPGVYNVSVYSTGLSSVKARIYEYSTGYLGFSLITETSNDSTTWKILPGKTDGQTGNYTIIVEILDESKSASYVVKCEKLPSLGVLQTDVLKEFTLDKIANLWHLLVFNASSGLNAYNFTYYKNESYSFTFELYDSLGLLIYDQSNPSNNTYWVGLVDSGIYYFYIKHTSTGPVKTWFRATPLNLTLLQPGESVNVHLNNTINSQEHYYYQLSVEEGKYYDIQLTTENTTNGAFKIYKGPANTISSLTFSWWGTGLTENVTDLIFWGEYSAFTDWDWNMSINWERSNLIYGSSWEGDYIDHSKMILKIYTNGGDGDATLTISNGTSAPEVSTTQSVLSTFNNTHGPHWYLYRVTNLTPVTAYRYTFEHIANSNLSTDFELRQSILTNGFYQLLTRPHYPAAVRTLVEKATTTAFSENYGNYPFNYTFEKDHFVSVAGDRWLFVDVPDAVQWGGYTVAPLMKGVVNISLEEHANVPITVGTPEIISTVDHGAVFTTTLTPNHHYSFSLEALNYSTSTSTVGGICNSSGFSIYPAYTFGAEPWIEENILYYNIHAKSISDIYFYLSSSGDGAMRMLISDITYSDIVLEGTLLVFGGLGGALIVGIILGFLIGKAKGKKK
ncbi:MAG: hypothetical protein ACTSUV_03420 [Candidatus Ranarchaeia archaeon]